MLGFTRSIHIFSESFQGTMPLTAPTRRSFLWRRFDEVLFVNPAEQIHPDTFSDEDSHSSKHEDDPLDDSDLDLLQAPMNFKELQSPASAEGSTYGDASSSCEDRQPSPRVAAA